MSALADLTDIQPDPIEPVTVPFGEWLPDVPALNNPGALEALNVIPAEGAYAPFLQHVPSALVIATQTVRGAATVVSPTNVVQIYAGAVNGIYTSVGGAFVNLLSTPVNADMAWQFVRVNEQMVAIHPDHVPVRSPVSSVTAAVNVGGSPPRAVCGTQVGDFLMLGNLIVDPDDSNGYFPSRVRWGGQNNIDLPWITNPATQADFQDMPSAGGPVTAIAGRTHGAIYQERMISRVTYHGPPEIFDIVTVEEKRGAIARDSVVDIGQFQFFIAEDGFFIWNGTNSTPISDGKVNRYFFNKLQYSARGRICGAVDFVNGCVMWGFPTSSSGLVDEIIIYSYRENKWSHSIQALEFLFSSAKSNVSEEELVLPAESYDTSFDSDYYLGGGRACIGAFNESHAYGLFNGAAMNAIIDTGEFSGPNGRRVFVNNIRPLVDLAVPSAKIQIIARDQMIGQPELFSEIAAQELDGQCPIENDARYMRFRLLLDAGLTWTHAVGVEASRKATGVF